MEATFKETLQIYLHKATLTFTNQFYPVNLVHTKIIHLLNSTLLLLVVI